MATDTPQFESFDQVADTTAKALDEAAANYAFQLFSDQGFRRLVNFDILSQVEQDRVFNELVVAYVVLVILVLEAPDLRVPREFRDYLVLLRRRSPRHIWTT